MNERIKQLNLQAMSIVMNGNDPDGDIEQMYIPSEFTKKFAELVVKETIDEMITQMWNYGMDESNNPQFCKMIDRTIQEMLDVAPSKD